MVDPAQEQQGTKFSVISWVSVTEMVSFDHQLVTV